MGRRSSLPPRPIFLREWIDALPEKTRKGAAAAGGVGISYVNNICKGKRTNVSNIVMAGFANYLGITIDDLYRRPPSVAALSELSTVSPAARQALIHPGRKNGH